MTARRSARPCPGPAVNHEDARAAPITADPLCEPCVRAVQAALEDMLGLYLALANDIAPRHRTDTAGRVSGGETMEPLPLDLAVLEMQDRMVEVLGCWAEVVRDTARLSQPEGRARDGWTISTCALTLRAHLGVLLSLPVTPVMRRVSLAEARRCDDDTDGWVRGGGATLSLDLDGAQACLEIMDVKWQARRLLGEVRGKDRMPMPCPVCDELALVHWHGADQVQCEACDGIWPEDDYHWLVRVLAADLERQGT